MPLIEKVDFDQGREFHVVVNDILYEEVDCIVNPANSGLSHGGGLAAAISEAAGELLDRECEAITKKSGRVPVGSAVVTTAGKLPFKGVIHAVGPRMGDGDEEGKIVAALQSAFLVAHQRHWRSLSFPGISSGIFSVPFPVCARAYVRGVEQFFREHADSPLKKIRLCLFLGGLLDAVVAELKRRRVQAGPTS